MCAPAHVHLFQIVCIEITTVRAEDDIHCVRFVNKIAKKEIMLDITSQIELQLNGIIIIIVAVSMLVLLSARLLFELPFLNRCQRLHKSQRQTLQRNSCLEWKGRTKTNKIIAYSFTWKGESKPRNNLFFLSLLFCRAVVNGARRHCRLCKLMNWRRIISFSGPYRENGRFDKAIDSLPLMNIDDFFVCLGLTAR